jgi:hypothetical protein
VLSLDVMCTADGTQHITTDDLHLDPAFPEVPSPGSTSVL